jgi:hypothetical protein
MTAAHEEESKRHDDNERRLAAENAFLRKQNEGVAEILRANDKSLQGDTTKFTELLEQRNEQIKAINLDDDFDSQLCSLCADAARTGLKTFSFCGRCPPNP